MNSAEPKIVTGRGGLRGRIVAPERGPDDRPEAEQVVIALDDGRRVAVPAALLSRRDDGSYALALAPEDLDAPAAEAPAPPGAPEQRVALAEEELHVGKRSAERQVQVHVQVHERQETVDLPLTREAVSVERVAVNRMVDRPPPVREEGDTTIVPLLEEVLWVEKRLMVREEVRITRQRSQTHRPEQVTLRREEARVERAGQPDGGGPSDPQRPGERA